MPKQQQKPDGFDPVKLSWDLREILSTIPVSGPEHVHKMDIVLSGLALLHNHLAKEANAKAKAEQTEREQI